MTEVRLVNIALAFLKVETVESLEEESEQAVLCRDYLQTCIDDSLTAMHHFSFSKVFISLDSPLSSVYRDYQYLYAAPPDMLQPIEMVNLNNGDWERVAAGIACNVNPLEMVYIKTISEVSSLPNHFARAVAYRLAMTVGPLISPALGQEIGAAVQLYDRYMREAANFDGRQNRLSVKGTNELLED